MISAQSQAEDVIVVRSLQVLRSSPLGELLALLLPELLSFFFVFLEVSVFCLYVFGVSFVGFCFCFGFGVFEFRSFLDIARKRG